MVERLTLEEEMSKEIEKGLEEYQKILDKYFGKKENIPNSCFEEASSLSKTIVDFNKLLMNRESNTVDKIDLLILSAIAFAQSKIQTDLATITYSNITDLKTNAYLVVYTPLLVLRRILRLLEEIAPKASSEVRKIISERLSSLEKKVEDLKKREVKIKLEGREDIIKTIEEIQKQMERAKKAQAQYTA